jgi:hypothetical protein
MTALRITFALLLVQHVVQPAISLKAMVVSESGPPTNALQSFLEARPPPAPYTTRAPVLALLFMVKDSIHNSHVWEAWLDQAKRDGLEAKIWIHAYAGETAKFRPLSFQHLVVNKTVPSEWCSIWDVQYLLLRQALADPHVTHIAYISESTIPVKPLSWMTSELRDVPDTRMCGCKDTEVAETWFVMSREDAEVFDAHEGAARELTGDVLSRWDCQEEVSWFTPLQLRHKKWPHLTHLSLQCTTFSLFSCNDVTGPWCENMEKFKPDAKVRDCLPKYEGWTNIGTDHPAEFGNLTSEAYAELLESPFWFARKFPEGTISPRVLPTHPL